ncbi:MAG: TetR family transcriptional regulator [Flavobacteriaceae bacterium CG02_land_8_20_14_3_00_34_13]|nr:TetR/AcrR family transcriptional regulator [Flavobacteriia bacterium]PIV50381.1 MAG: TetR family transcriptional regulator [Flavobacteriaceae bacterium CG02_land_8_20_14_3_00_34_13]PIZ08282.1 MAG: TetR family transcriptional regulator [Flavobacteriaceae bacterium CG_4_10_14_0_8_um_filter_34_31]PJC08621.1 MAG: TetR family transcriptional regulator [Flavobacteriaceae bacterium CG_4_9_14_0_8_um_filter_34_30]
MKEKILEKASEMFLNLGFKSVTMDDLANEMGISKKTIYLHFVNKTKLVEATTNYVFHAICDGIDCIRLENKNPIEEILTINEFVKQILKNEKTSPQFQLQKYYPKIYKKLKENQFTMMNACVIQNLNKGIEMGLYRENLNIEIISRLYFLGHVGIRDQELFPEKQFNSEVVLDTYLDYHLRGISTEKGKKQLINFLNNDN